MSGKRKKKPALVVPEAFKRAMHEAFAIPSAPTDEQLRKAREVGIVHGKTT